MQTCRVGTSRKQLLEPRWRRPRFWAAAQAVRHRLHRDLAGKKADETRPQEWTVFLRSANADEDMSTYIKKVVFILHPTLQPPTRVLETAPFEVTEFGGASSR